MGTKVTYRLETYKVSKGNNETWMDIRRNALRSQEKSNISVMAKSDKDRDGNDGNEDEMRPVEVLCIHSCTLH